MHAADDHGDADDRQTHYIRVTKNTFELRKLRSSYKCVSAGIRADNENYENDFRLIIDLFHRKSGAENGFP